MSAYFPAATPQAASLDSLSDAMRIIAPPSELQRFRAVPGEGPGQWARYTAHAAYMLAQPTLGEQLRAIGSFGRFFGVILAKRLTSYELIPAHVRAKKNLSFAMAALGNMWRRLTDGSKVNLSPSAEATLASLESDGICVAALPDSQFQSIYVAARPLFEKLRARRGLSALGGRKFEDSRDSALRTEYPKLFDAVEETLISNGLLAAVSAYLGRRARLVDVNPQVNDASDNFWQRTFVDLPDVDCPARYFHKDASGGDVKAILYMSDVGPRSGPFSYAIGSHAAFQSVLESWVEETNDQAGLSSTDLSTRRRFMALPAPLRRKCAVGNDLLPDDDATKKLLGAEWIVVAPRGHIVLFDTKGMHRGGMVSDGEREVLTCVLG